jgi:hypothetical protein
MNEITPQCYTIYYFLAIYSLLFHLSCRGLVFGIIYRFHTAIFHNCPCYLKCLASQYCLLIFSASLDWELIQLHRLVTDKIASLYLNAENKTLFYDAFETHGEWYQHNIPVFCIAGRGCQHFLWCLLKTGSPWWACICCLLKLLLCLTD